MISRKILIVDDEEILIRTFSKLLTKKGYSVTGVLSGTEAVQIIQRESFDLLICDIRMPGINGFQTIRQIRDMIKFTRQSEIPVILISGYLVDPVMELEILRIMPNLFMTKPFDTHFFLEKISWVLENRKNSRPNLTFHD